MSLARSTLGAAFPRRFAHRITPLSSSISRSSRLALTTAQQQQHRNRRAFGDYGSGTGDPKGEDPLAQGDSAAASSELEHPGPPSPSTAGKGSGGGSASSESAAADDDGNKGAAKPKIHNEASPPPENQSAETKRHNEEMANRADKASETAD